MRLVDLVAKPGSRIFNINGCVSSGEADWEGKLRPGLLGEAQRIQETGDTACQVFMLHPQDVFFNFFADVCSMW